MRFFEMHKDDTVALNANIEDSKINQQKLLPLRIELMLSYLS